MGPKLGNLLKAQVSETAIRPIHTNVPRVGASKYLRIYENIESHDDLLLKFAKLDFNICKKGRKGFANLQALSPAPSGWSTSQPFCSWKKVNCDKSSGTVTSINLDSQSVSDLELSYNNLTGSLPASFGGSEIMNLWLNNQVKGLSGTIHVIGDMTQLSQLRDNQFTGIVPESVMALPKLLNITLQNNKLQDLVITGPAATDVAGWRLQCLWLSLGKGMMLARVGVL
ncbi:hypothetical protein HAX54_005614 [Datura stramonium]|uniref:Leucine-rich repeat-containing N-terminal plant-type domain-containing protein n=1 Tax=Datura stramonium TaxID=4076 RepID=A0ABS8TAN6_DATST|nr:hypothetical protein [Datura stramonium]